MKPCTPMHSSVTLLPPYPVPHHDSLPPLHCEPFHAYRTSYLHPASSLWHAPTSMQSIICRIGHRHVRIHRCSHESNVNGQLIKRKMLTNEQDWGSVYMYMFSVKNEYFVFVYIKAMLHLDQYVSTKNAARCCINKHPREFHVTAIPRAQSWDAFSNVPRKQVAANKKKQFAWTDDEAQLLPAVTHGCKINHLVEGTHDYRQTQVSVFITVLIFAVYMSVFKRFRRLHECFERFHLLRFRSLHLGLRIQKFPFSVCVFIVLV